MPIGREALDEPFAVVETIHTEQQLAAKQTRDEPLHLLIALRFRSLGSNGLDVDADGKDADVDLASIGDDVRCRADRLLAENVAYSRSKPPQVLLGLKTDEIVLTEIANELRVHRQDAEHFDVRKRNVQEEAERPVHSGGAQIAPCGDELVVVNPDWTRRVAEVSHGGCD